MARHRPRHRPRWLWPLSWALAAALVAVLVLLPASWWQALWPRGELRERPTAGRFAPALRLVSVEAMRPPPPVRVVADADRPRPRPQPTDAAASWWERSWRVRLDVEGVGAAPALPDTLVPAPLVALWGARPVVDLIVAAPDSVLRARLQRLVLEERLAADDLHGLFSAVARARAYVDLERREAAMFDEFGRDQVRVPD